MKCSSVSLMASTWLWGRERSVQRQTRKRGKDESNQNIFLKLHILLRFVSLYGSPCEQTLLLLSADALGWWFSITEAQTTWVLLCWLLSAVVSQLRCQRASVESSTNVDCSSCCCRRTRGRSSPLMLQDKLWINVPHVTFGCSGFKSHAYRPFTPVYESASHTHKCELLLLCIP